MVHESCNGLISFEWVFSINAPSHDLAINAARTSRASVVASQFGDTAWFARGHANTILATASLRVTR